MELALNMGTFEVLDYSELFAVDGGIKAEVWIGIGCAVAGAVVGAVIGGPVGTAVGAKYGYAAGALVNAGISLLCGAIGTYVAKKIVG